MNDEIMYDEVLAFEEYVDLKKQIDEGFDKISISIATAIALEEANPNLDIISEFIDYDIATESIDTDVFKTKLNSFFTDLNGLVFRMFKRFSPMTDRSKSYKVAKLQQLKKDIESGKLVPKTAADKISGSGINNKLAVFYASGYSLARGSSDLVKFINGLMALTGKTSIYMNGLLNTYNKLSTMDETRGIAKLSGLLNVKQDLHGINPMVNRKVTITDIRMSIPDKWFSSGINLVMLTNTSKRGIKLHTDGYSFDSNKQIGPASNKDTIALLDTGIEIGNNLSSVYGGISFFVRKLVTSNTMQLLLSIAGSENKNRRFLLAKYSESVSRSLINLYTDIYTIDILIISYINATYKPGTATDKPSK